MKKLFTCLYGSNLYGTNTPESDRDIKHIVLPELDDLLLGKKLVNKVYKTNKKENTRNTSADVDEEFIPLQIFANDFLQGQTYALELAFAVGGSHAEQRKHGSAEQCELFQLFIEKLQSSFLTSNIKAMMGYAVNQASTYSFKGERLNVAREFLVLLSKHYTPRVLRSLQEIIFQQEDDYNPNHNMNLDMQELTTKYPKYFKVGAYDIGGNRLKPCYILLDKIIPLTMTIDHAIGMVKSTIKKYGDRADVASASNVDWKATAHSIRIVNEGLELLETGKIEFPLSPIAVAHFLAIKRGEVPIAEVTSELDMKLDRLKDLEKTTTLPAYSEDMREDFDEFLVNYLYQFYNL